MKGNARLSFLRLLMLGLMAGALGAARAAMFVYELPDGSRIITDHALKGKHYKLIRATRHVKGVGALAASSNRQVFRAHPDSYDDVIVRMASAYGLEPSLVKAVMHAESAFNPYATSRKGASGLMQLMPATAEQYGVTDIYDPVQNIQAGVRHLKYLLRKYDNKYHLALAAYNAGERAVRRYRGIPPYRETRRYVKKVLRFKRRYASLG